MLQRQITVIVLLKDLENGSIADVGIQQNAEVPTGKLLYVNFENSRNTKITYVSDINEVQKLLKDKGIAYTLTDVKRQNMWITVLVPTVLAVIIVIFIILMITNRQAGGGSKFKR